jgi:hypothetical protein
MGTAADRKKDFEEAHRIAQHGWMTSQQQSKDDLKVYLGDAWTTKDRTIFMKQKREAMSFPMLRRNIKLISGYQRKNRLSIKFEPQEGSDDRTAQTFTEVGTWVMQRGNGHNVMSDAFENCLITGINLVNIYNDRNQQTFFDRFFYNQFLLDPNFAYRDLRDCHFGLLRKYITKDDANMLLPNSKGFIAKLQETASVDGRFPNYLAPTLFGEKLLAYDEWQSRTTKEEIVTINRTTGAEEVWKGTKKQLEDLFVRDPNLAISHTFITRRIPTVEVTSYLQDQEVSHGIDSFGIGDFSFTPVIAFWHPEALKMEDKLRSVVHGAKDMQRASDKRMMAMVSRFDQQIGGGLDFEEETLVDEDDAFSSGQKPRKFKKGAIMDGRMKDRTVQGIDASEFQLHQLFNEQMVRSMNINEDLLGTATGNPKIAGVLAQFRAGQALVGLRDLFDNLSLTQKIIGEKLLKLIQQYSPRRIQRITGKEPPQQFYTRNFGEFDSVVTEGMETDSQRNLFYTELVQLKQLGDRFKDPVPFSWGFILKNFAPVAMRAELAAEVTKNEQQQNQQREQEQKIRMQQLTVDLELAKGNIVANRGIAAAQQAKAVEDQSDAALNRVKTIAEIQDIGQARVLELAALGLQFEQLAQQNREVSAKS